MNVRKNFLLLAASVLCFVPQVRAQDAPKVELFGGYSYNLFDDSRFSTKRFSLNGWNASLTWNANHWISFVADVSGHYSSVDTTLIIVPNPPIQTQHDRRQHAFLFGPRLSYRKNPRFVPYTHVLLGAVRFTEDLNTTLLPASKNTGFGLALGGGLDLRLSERFALRAAQVDYQFSHQSLGQNRHNFRYSGGIVFRLGKRQ